MAHEEDHGHRDPIIITSPRRFAKGLAILIVIVAIGAAILIPNFNEMNKNPPPVSRAKPVPVAPTGTTGNATGGASGAPIPGVTTIAILAGAQTQGNKAYEPDPAQVPEGNKVQFKNEDTAVHTATSGTSSSDPAMGKIFDTTFLDPGKPSTALTLTGAKAGDTINYFCQVHPFMKGTIKVVAAQPGGSGSSSSGAAPSGVTLKIPSGANTQGNPSFDPNPLIAHKGDTVSVINADTVPHTVTSGTATDDPNSGKLFDTSYIDPGKTVTITLDKVSLGDNPFYCQVHPFMKGVIKVS